MCAVTAAPSAKSMSLMVVLRILVFALSLAMLYSLPSDLVCMYTPSVAVPKARLRRREKNLPKSVGARTHPCFTPLLMLKGSDMLPSY